MEESSFGLPRGPEQTFLPDQANGNGEAEVVPGSIGSENLHGNASNGECQAAAVTQGQRAAAGQGAQGAASAASAALSGSMVTPAALRSRRPVCQTLADGPPKVTNEGLPHATTEEIPLAAVERCYV